MPTVICPACSRVIVLPPDEIALPAITCVRCETSFSPAEHVSHTPGRRLAPGVWVALAIAIPAVVLSFVLLQVILHRESTGEKRDGGRTGEEALVKAYIINNAGEDAARVKFLAWGPHMDEAELRGLAKEAGADSIVGLLLGSRRPITGLEKTPWFGPFNSDGRLFFAIRAVVRVRYEGPPRGPRWTPEGVIDNRFQTHDSLFLIADKQVALFGDVRRGAGWKGELREELSRVFPAIKRP